MRFPQQQSHHSDEAFASDRMATPIAIVTAWVIALVVVAAGLALMGAAP